MSADGTISSDFARAFCGFTILLDAGTVSDAIVFSEDAVQANVAGGMAAAGS
jgi:hypothetical protein